MPTVQLILGMPHPSAHSSSSSAVVAVYLPSVDDMERLPLPAHLRHGFSRAPDGGNLAVIQAIDWWRNEATGELVWVPDPSWGPPRKDDWVNLGPWHRGLDERWPNVVAPPLETDPPVLADPATDTDQVPGGGEEPVPRRDAPVESELRVNLDALLKTDAVPDYARLGFRNSIEGMSDVYVPQVIVFWRNAVTGDAVWTPNPAWLPPETGEWVVDPILDGIGTETSVVVTRPGLIDPPVDDGGSVVGEPRVDKKPLGPSGPPGRPDGVPDDTVPAHVRHGFIEWPPMPDVASIQVTVDWRHVVTGEVVEAPNLSWGPPRREDWICLGSSLPVEGGRDPGKEEPPIDTDPPPVDGQDPQPSNPPGGDGGSGGDLPSPPDLAVVVYHWKHRAVLEKSAWRVGEQVEALVGEPLPRLFRPVFEDDAAGQRKLGLSALARGSQAPDAAANGAPGSAPDPVAAGLADAATSDGAAINLRDAVAILRMLAGRPVADQAQAPSPFESIAADFDGDGAVGLGDALGVLRHATGAGGPKPAWAFVDESDPALPGRAGLNPGRLPEEPTGPGALKGKVGLVGVLRGDIDGSWAPPQAAEQLGDAWFSDLAGRIGERHADAGVDSSRWGVYPG